MKDYPLYLFLFGLIVICVSFAANANLVPIFTSFSYIIGFAIGLIFKAEGTDAGGGTTNNIWIIWTVVFILAVILSMLCELVKNKLKNK